MFKCSFFLRCMPAMLLVCAFISPGCIHVAKETHDTTSRTVPVQTAGRQTSPAVPSLHSIEELSAYLHYIGFKKIPQDTFLNRHFEIKITDMESEGVEWKGYEFKRDGVLLLLAENSWADSLMVHRITYITAGFSTKSGVHPGISFRDMKHAIDTVRLNGGGDGELVLFDKDNPDLFYDFDISNLPSLYYGVSSINDVPDSLKLGPVVIVMGFE